MTELAHRWPYLVFIGLWLIASDGWAQGPLRRLGGRVREAIQTGAPLAPPVAPSAQGQAAGGQAAPAASAAGAQTRFPALRPGATAGARTNAAAGARTGAAASARPTGPSANYQRATSTAAAQANQPARSNSPSAIRPNSAAMSNRLPQPAYAAPASSRAGISSLPGASRQPNGVAATVGGEALNLEAAKLGLMVSDETLATVNHQSSRAPRGVLVTAVLVGSGGDAAGLEIGDRLLAVNGRLVNQAEPLVDMVDQIAPGDPIELKFNREGKLHSTVGLASGPTGKLDQEEFAIVRQQAREMLGEPSASQGDLPAANGETTGSGSALGGIGSVLGSWLGSSAGKASPEASDVDPSVPVVSEPNARDVDAAEAAKTKEYKSLRPSVGVLAAPGVAGSDPPSLEGELGPDDSAMEVAETLPAPRPADDEDATVNQLLQEIRLLRERVQQLEAQKASEVR